ncbi:NeuD/PglB/VioB family sugar acetyltransferase [Enterococcus xiangfangensis]|uniref:NeuD/PglB/VioB family sugar acetyltransferase n=1 Tax=Enterococcus xiangfangensis TaxID=1296537 RepID=UPI0010F87087|nr:NeuD/PglB/VioB family sugar acetyltransferase [Enterococcus xiangfangensis]MBM7712757.1 sugar O-acyltransferase (sialic acid O-acetyltransferase NeuD family) [Enterococcus xiangfangensis]
MDDLIIIGAGGFAKEIAFLLQRASEYNLIGFVDDEVSLSGQKLAGKPILGPINMLLSYDKPISVAIGIASSNVKKKIYSKLKKNQNINFPNLVDTTALVGVNVKLGIGNILMANSTYTADINIGDFNMINIGSTVGHDSNIGDFNSIFPSVNISGYVTIGNNNQIGVGTKIIQSICIADNSIIGAGSVVIQNIENNTKNVGVPTRIIESWE